MPQNIPPTKIPKAKGKARGSFFADKDTLPYTAKGIVLGQARPESCVPAVCRMLIFDQYPELKNELSFSESYLRDFLKTDATGSVIFRIPSALRLANINDYVYRNDLTFADLRSSVADGHTIVSVFRNFIDAGHVLIIEEITDAGVAVRDSLPDNTGSSYRVRHEDFLAVWLARNNQRGVGIVVVK